jgi:hypothetical protein
MCSKLRVNHLIGYNKIVRQNTKNATKIHIHLNNLQWYMNKNKIQTLFIFGRFTFKQFVSKSNLIINPKKFGNISNLNNRIKTTIRTTSKCKNNVHIGNNDNYIKSNNTIVFVFNNMTINISLCFLVEDHVMSIYFFLQETPWKKLIIELIGNLHDNFFQNKHFWNLNNHGWKNVHEKKLNHEFNLVLDVGWQISYTNIFLSSSIDRS